MYIKVTNRRSQGFLFSLCLMGLVAVSNARGLPESVCEGGDTVGNGLRGSVTCFRQHAGAVGLPVWEDEDAPAPSVTAPAPQWPRSVSVGAPALGALVYGARLKSDHSLKSRPGRNYGTLELVDMIRRATRAVFRKHSRSPRLHVGDLSRKRGGPFSPHVSHQSGRDVDIGYYLRRGHTHKWFQKVRRGNLDVKRTWTLIESFLRSGQIEYVFSHRRLIPSLYRHARKLRHLTADDLALYFGDRSKDRRGLIRHLKGHDDHLHIRIYAPDSIHASREYARRHGHAALRSLLKRLPRKVKIRRGDSLYRIAKRHRISTKKLRKWNRLRGRSPRLIAGRRIIVGYVHPWDLKKVTHAHRRANLRHGKTRKRAKKARTRVARRLKKKLRKRLVSKRDRRKRARRKSSKRKGRRSLRHYRVRSGDSLISIARRFGVSSADICRINRLQRNCAWQALRLKSRPLRLGQILKIRRRS